MVVGSDGHASPSSYPIVILAVQFLWSSPTLEIGAYIYIFFTQSICVEPLEGKSARISLYQMASSIMALSSTAAVAAVAAPPKTGNSNVVSAFTGLKSMAQFPSSKTMSNAGAEWEQKTTSNGARVRCMQVWPPYSNKKFETLSYLPRLSPEQLVKEVEYLLKNKWVPCLEFEEDGEIKRVYGNSPGYYDGRYWVMWKLPMFGCTEASQVLNEVNECAKAYPNAFIRVIGFDNVRQVQCISFIVHKPEYN